LRAVAAEAIAAAGLFAPAAAKFAAMRGLTILAVRVPAQAVRQRLAPAAVDRTRRQRIAAAVVVVMLVVAAVVVMPAVVAAVVVVMPAVVAADTGNLNAAA
jgi:hypothetical protein